ncbi:MAG: NlpC/P60 family protein [Verrucomicrobiota bacterium]
MKILATIAGFGLLLGTASVLVAQPAAVSSIKPRDLVEYESAPPAIQRLIESSLKLTRRDLAYTFGSNSPTQGGMDCSGTIQHTLQSLGFAGVPRMSHLQYLWAKKHGRIIRTDGVHSTDHAVFSKLMPGDLLFWEGTYAVAERDPPISHVMIYLGTLKADGKGVVFGASSGRRYRGKKIHGVSVMDWRVPSKASKSKFVAYGPIPGLRGWDNPDAWHREGGE